MVTRRRSGRALEVEEGPGRHERRGGARRTDTARLPAARRKRSRRGCREGTANLTARTGGGQETVGDRRSAPRGKSRASRERDSGRAAGSGGMSILIQIDLDRAARLPTTDYLRKC